MTDKRIVLTNCGSESEAEKIANFLVEHRLAACVNMVPRIKSVYRWQGKVESAEEWLLLAKTTVIQVEAVCDAIRELHSYELPEIIVIAVEGGSAEYLNWIEDSVGRTGHS